MSTQALVSANDRLVRAFAHAAPIIEQATDALNTFGAMTMDWAREHGRCSRCGYVFCDGNDHAQGSNGWPRVCHLEDAPTR